MKGKDRDLRPEYPAKLIKSGMRGKYARRKMQAPADLVRIDADLQKLFPDSAAVNRALREYAGRQKPRQR
jgi:hypothetical protein